MFDVSVSESDNIATFTIFRSGNLNIDTVVNFSTFDGTALARFDFVEVSGSAFFNSGTSSLSVLGPLLDDTDGNDTLLGNGGIDVLRGGGGDYVPAVSDTTFRRIDGGFGINNLRLDVPASALISRRYPTAGSPKSSRSISRAPAAPVPMPGRSISRTFCRSPIPPTR